MLYIIFKTTLRSLPEQGIIILDQISIIDNEVLTSIDTWYFY